MDDDQLLILGGRSLVGDFLGPQLVRSGYRPAALSRRPPVAASAFSWIEGDLGAPGLAAALPRLNGVISLCPIWVLKDGLPALLEKGARRVIAFSSTSRTTKIASSDATERAVAEALAQGEDDVIRLCEASGASWNILRPTLIYSEGRDGNVTRLAGLIRRFGFLPLAGNGAGLRQPVHAEDLAQAVQAVLNNPLVQNRAYDLVGGETLTYRAMVERIFEGLEQRPRILSVPPAVWRAAFALARPVFPGATQAMGERMSRDLVFDDSAARRDLAWRPRSFHPKFQIPASSRRSARRCVA